MVQRVKEMYHIMDKLSPISLRKIQTSILMLVYLHRLLGFASKFTFFNLQAKCNFIYIQLVYVYLGGSRIPLLVVLNLKLQ